MPYTTYADLIDHVSAFLGKDVSTYGATAVKRAIQSALLDWPTQHDWIYYQTQARINTVAAYSTGTVAYDHTGGTYELELTLTGGTWPTWIAYGYVRINNINYKVNERKSSTVITLDSDSNPGEDVASGTSYTAFRDTYSLPANFASAGEIIRTGSGWCRLHLATPQDLVSAEYIRNVPAEPTVYSIVAGQTNDGRMGIRFFPPPDQIYQFDMAYRRRPVALVNEQVNAGKVTVAASGTSVTGHGTAFTARLIGSIIRVSADGESPTGLTGTNPYLEERKVTAVASATSLTVDSAWTYSGSRVGYVCSDMVDCEPGAMLNALLRNCEHHARLTTRMKPIPGETESLMMAIAAAKEADNRSYAIQSAGTRRYGRRIQDMASE